MRSVAALAWNSQEPNACFARDPSLLAPAVRPFANYPGGHAEGFPDAFKPLFHAAYDAIDAATASVPFSTLADGHHASQWVKSLASTISRRFCQLCVGRHCNQPIVFMPRFVHNHSSAMIELKSKRAFRSTASA